MKLKRSIFATMALGLALFSNCFAQQSFELIIGEKNQYESFSFQQEFQGHIYISGYKHFQESNIPLFTSSYFTKISNSGELILQNSFPKLDTFYGVHLGMPKSNENLLFFGEMSHKPAELYNSHIYICELNTNLELIWEKAIVCQPTTTIRAIE